MKKKYILLLLIIVFSVTSCSNKSVYKESQAEVSLAIDPMSLSSIIENTSSVVIVGDLNYDETIMEKGKPIPNTIYDAKRIKIMGPELKIENNFEETLSPNDKMIKISMSGGEVTKGEIYENLPDVKKSDSAGKKKIEKPSLEESKEKVKLYNDYYCEFEKNKIYLILSKSDLNSDEFYCNCYRVFEYDKEKEVFINPVTNLKFTIDEFNSENIK